MFDKITHALRGERVGHLSQSLLTISDGSGKVALPGPDPCPILIRTPLSTTARIALKSARVNAKRESIHSTDFCISRTAQ